MRRALFALIFVCADARAQSARYRIDPVHSQVVFFVEHAGFSQAMGRVLRPAGELTFDPTNFAASDVQVALDAGAIDFGEANWNKAMQGKSYFNTTRFPVIRFRSTEVVSIDNKNAKLTGVLEFLGQHYPLAFNFRFNKQAPHPYTRQMTVGFSADVTLSRKALGMPAAASVIGDAVALRLEIEATKVRAPKTPGKQ